ncbi:MAG: molybdopterin-guanine dinucleotide biosynthesis protein B [Acetobacteraceae bacterium]|nr:molybdopterin-guanine dinucleotide biosynthesis protein B [Acetobacteraceae bacterium]
MERRGAVRCRALPVEGLVLNVLGIVGWSGSGKTTLTVALLPLLRACGMTVSTIKHAHHGFDMDQPGKDSHRHRVAGAREVLVVSSRRWALLHEIEGPEPGLADLLARMVPVDLVLVEGFKSHPGPKLEVWRPILGKPPLWDHEPGVVAVATDSTPDIGSRVLLPLNQPEAIAIWIRTRVVTSV